MAAGYTLLEYATLLHHFSIGIDFMTSWCWGPNIVSLQPLPRLKYKHF